MRAGTDAHRAAIDGHPAGVRVRAAEGQFAVAALRQGAGTGGDVATDQGIAGTGNEQVRIDTGNVASEGQEAGAEVAPGLSSTKRHVGIDGVCSGGGEVRNTARTNGQGIGAQAAAVNGHVGRISCRA